MNIQIDQDGEDVVLTGRDDFLNRIINENKFKMALDTVRSARWLYYSSFVWAEHTKYLGIEVMKFPTDMWVMQELITELKPDLLIETGTWKGGSALYYAHIMDMTGHGKVVTIDNDPKDNLPSNWRIKYLVGDCLSDEVVNQVKKLIPVNGHVLVNLDSAHYKDHILKEMEIYSKFVTVGSYMVVEDGILGHPVKTKDKDDNYVIGPYEAINEFLKSHPEFESDRTKEKFQITANIKGYLRKVVPNA